MRVVFVPQDLTFMQLSVAQLNAISPMLIPVLAHDRSGFGGGLLSSGLLILIIARNAALSRSFVELIGIMGLCGFGAALGVHVAIGYLDFSHLAPAYAGLLLFITGLTMCAIALRKERMFRQR
jgi:energy-converting hydrogenase Eha subunit G